MVLNLLHTPLLEVYAKFHDIWSIIKTWLLWEKQFCNVVFFKDDFLGTVIPQTYTLQVEYLGPGVRYTVNFGVILKL